jgi:hypothetical protein
LTTKNLIEIKIFYINLNNSAVMFPKVIFKKQIV